MFVYQIWHEGVKQRFLYTLRFWITIPRHRFNVISTTNQRRVITGIQCHFKHLKRLEVPLPCSTILSLPYGIFTISFPYTYPYPPPIELHVIIHANPMELLPYFFPYPVEIRLSFILDPHPLKLIPPWKFYYSHHRGYKISGMFSAIQ